jgi:hypothetical protein
MLDLSDPNQKEIKAHMLFNINISRDSLSYSSSRHGPPRILNMDLNCAHNHEMNIMEAT